MEVKSPHRNGVRTCHEDKYHYNIKIKYLRFSDRKKCKGSVSAATSNPMLDKYSTWTLSSLTTSFDYIGYCHEIRQRKRKDSSYVDYVELFLKIVVSIAWSTVFCSTDVEDSL